MHLTRHLRAPRRTALSVGALLFGLMRLTIPGMGVEDTRLLWLA